MPINHDQRPQPRKRKKKSPAKNPIRPAKPPTVAPEFQSAPVFYLKNLQKDKNFKYIPLQLNMCD
jgi:hypothetical protein